MKARVLPGYTYGFYKVFSKLHGTKTKIFPLKEDFTIDPQDYMGLAEGLIVINQPQRPNRSCSEP